MEEMRIETTVPCMIEEANLTLPPRRRSHLQSKTFKDFLQILSLYVDDSPNYPDLQVFSEIPQTGNDCTNSEVATQNASQEKSLFSENGMRTDKNVEHCGIQQKALDSSEIANEIEHNMVGMKGNDEHQFDLSTKENHLNIVNELENNTFKDLGQGRQESLRKRESMGNGLSVSVISVDNTEDKTSCFERNIGNMTEHERLQIESASLILLDDKDTEEGEIVDNGVFSIELDDILRESSIVLEQRKVDGNGDMIEHGKLHLEKDTVAKSSLGTLNNKEAEQGKILDGSTCQLGNKYLEDSMVLVKRMADDEQIPKDHSRQKVFDGKHSEQSVADGNDKSLKKEQVKLRKSDEKAGKKSGANGSKISNVSKRLSVDAKEVNNFNGGSMFPVADRDSFEHSGAVKENQENTSMEKKAKVGDKRKRSTTTESKARKRLKARQKRAEKNKELGVKRLKLQPISKPKPVRYCNYYLNGRCQQGDSCKFSHDITPLTKSQPCKFLVQNSCLKGDECPFDHQLSKYPCNNYKSNGYCNRGESCLFSHKISQDSNSTQASNGNQKESESSSKRPFTDSGRHLHSSIAKEALRTPVQRYSNKNSVETALKFQSQTAKGMSFAGRPVNTNSPSAQILNLAKLTTLRTPSSVENPVHGHPGKNVGELGPKPPAQTPKGISFLSFGKPLFDDANKQQQGNSLPENNKASESSSGKTPNKSDKFYNSNDRSWKTLASPFSVSNSSKQGELEKSQNLNGLPLKKPLFQLSFWDSKKAIAEAEAQTKNTPSSAQKALLSTMEFASKYQSRMMIDRSIKLPASFGTDTDKGSSKSSSNSLSIGSIQKGSMTASKILQEFLFGGGDNKKA